MRIKSVFTPKNVILFSIFPIIFALLITYVEVRDDENWRQFAGFAAGIFTFPTYLLIFPIFYLLKIVDPYSFYGCGVAGTIQYGLIIFLIDRHIKKRDKVEKFEEQLFNELKDNHKN